MCFALVHLLSSCYPPFQFFSCLNDPDSWLLFYLDLDLSNMGSTLGPRYLLLSCTRLVPFFSPIAINGFLPHSVFIIFLPCRGFFWGSFASAWTHSCETSVLETVKHPNHNFFPLFPLSLFPSFPLSLFPSFPLSLFPSFPLSHHLLFASPSFFHSVVSPFLILLCTSPLLLLPLLRLCLYLFILKHLNNLTFSHGREGWQDITLKQDELFLQAMGTVYWLITSSMTLYLAFFIIVSTLLNP